MNNPLDDALETQDWKKIIKRLTAYAKRKLGRNGKIQDAEEIASEAIRQVLDPEYRDWKPEECDLLWHLQSNVNGILSNRWRTKSKTEERLRDFKKETSDERFHADDNTVARIANAQALDKALDLAIAANDELAQAVIMEANEGLLEPQEVATKLGVAVGKVYEARRRLKAYLEEAVLQEKEE